MSNYIVKPFTAEVLQEKMNKIFQESSCHQVLVDGARLPRRHHEVTRAEKEEATVLNGNVKLYDELGELARYLDIGYEEDGRGRCPDGGQQRAVPQATAHLLDLNKMTEEGTLEVMRLAEIIQENRARAAKELVCGGFDIGSSRLPTLAARLGKTAEELAQDDKHLMDIMTALSFQDLVAQRVKKLVTIVEDVQCKLVELVVVFGLKQEGTAPGDPRKGR